MFAFAEDRSEDRETRRKQAKKEFADLIEDRDQTKAVYE